MTLTTADPQRGAERFADGMAVVVRRLRKRWPVEYFAKVEFTTGKSARSGGQRRMHAHVLVKGLADADLVEVESLVRESWRAVTGAFVVEVSLIRTPAGALHYLGLHHAKASQLPPPEWRGMVERASRRYWAYPIAQLRDEARRQLWAESLVWSSGLTLEDARLLVDIQCDQRVQRQALVREVTAVLREFRISVSGEADAAPVVPAAFEQLPLPEEFPW